MEVLRILVQRHIDHVREDEGKEITEDEALGQLVAKYAKWNGVRILDVAASALEDARFDTECGVVERMSKQLRDHVNPV